MPWKGLTYRKFTYERILKRRWYMRSYVFVRNFVNFAWTWKLNFKWTFLKTHQFIVIFSSLKHFKIISRNVQLLLILIKPFFMYNIILIQRKSISTDFHHDFISFIISSITQSLQDFSDFCSVRFPHLSSSDIRHERNQNE
jgi:hypothetical protein